MKRVGLTLILALFLTSLVSADILITKNPESSYNLGDVIDVPVKVTTLGQINNFLRINLICNGAETEVYKEYILLNPGEEKESNIKFPLITNFTKISSGACSIKAILGEDFVLTDEFKISNTVTITIQEFDSEVAPGKSLFILADAKKSKGDNVEGFVEASITKDETEILTTSDTVNLGFVELNITLPDDLAAEDYLVKLSVYEKDIEDQITNIGSTSFGFAVSQVPTSLEITFEEQEINPGTDMRIKTILHDQTGKKIKSTSEIKITDTSEDKIYEEDLEIQTDEFFDFSIPYNQAPGEWKVEAKSGALEAEASFEIKELAQVEVTIINKTLLIKNTGNIFYNDTVLVKIGNETLNVDVQLEVDKEQKYSLKAPEGKYEVEVMGIRQQVALTGNAISVKEIGALSTIIRYPIVWLFMLAIMGYVTYLFSKKGYTRTFVGYVTKKRGKEKDHYVGGSAPSLVNSKNKAELSLSIKGEKQNINLICLKIKNINEIKDKDDIKHTIQEVTEMAESNKASTYENQGNIFFLFAPITTKTFKNERTTVLTAEKIKETLEHHNKINKTKIEFGISINSGSIIAKKEHDSLEFMSLGTLVTTAKKIALKSKGEILMGEKFKEQSATDVKSEKIHDKNTTSYKVKEVRSKKHEDKKFIDNFIKRLEGHKD